MVALLPAGLNVNAQEKVSASFSASELCAALGRTVPPRVAMALTLAFATGGTLCVLIVTVSLRVLLWASVTANCTMYAPSTSATNVGVIDDEFDNVAALPTGFEMKVHWYESRSPSASLDALPSSCTVLPSVTS